MSENMNHAERVKELANQLSIKCYEKAPTTSIVEMEKHLFVAIDAMQSARDDAERQRDTWKAEVKIFQSEVSLLTAEREDAERLQKETAKELDSRIKECDFLVNRCKLLAWKVAARDAEVERLREDAERYRWLRDKAQGEIVFDRTEAQTDGGHHFKLIIPFDGEPIHNDEHSAMKLNEAIDAALSEEVKGGE